jgi:predicted Na+-dependent transporter
MSGYDRFSQWLLPVGVLLALIAGLTIPEPGQSLGAIALGPLDVTAASVIVIFLISGIAIRSATLHLAGLPRAAVMVCVLNLVLAPTLAGLLLTVVSLPIGLVFGLAAIISVPTTLSSAAVLTQVAGGDQAWGTALTVLCVFVGAITAPLAVSLLLSAEVVVPAGPLLLQLVLLVVVPSALGYLVARGLGWQVNRFWRLVPSLGVILLAWITVSESAETVQGTPGQQLLLAVMLVIGGHAVMLLLARIASAGLPRERAIPVFFVTAQKTLPLALTIIAAVAALVPELQFYAADAVVVAVLWHFLQLLVDGSLAARWGHRVTSSATGAA